MDTSRNLVWIICIATFTADVSFVVSGQKTSGMQYQRQRGRNRGKSGSDKKAKQKIAHEYIEDANAPDEQRLMSSLLFNYEPASRPVFNASDVVRVKFGLTLAQIFDMASVFHDVCLNCWKIMQDEVNQVLTTNVWLEQEWMDERLRWNPADYSGLSILRVPCQRIWLPDIVLYNSADDFTEGFMQSKAMVSHNGVVFWPPPAKLRSSCKIDITYFPFDDQKCRMKFGSWTYDGFQVDVTNRSSYVDLANYVFSGEWELLDITVKRNEVYYACCIEPYPDVTFMFIMRRRTLYYLFNIIFPCLWLTVLSLLGFWLPPDSGEKITLGITVLLAFSVFMLLIAESMPATSEFVPLIGIYLTVTMAMTSLSIMLTVFVLQLHHAGPHQSPVPGWLRTLMIGHVARVLCMRSHLVSYYGPSWTGIDDIKKNNKTCGSVSHPGKYSLASVETDIDRGDSSPTDYPSTIFGGHRLMHGGHALTFSRTRGVTEDMISPADQVHRRKLPLASTKEARRSWLGMSKLPSPRGKKTDGNSAGVNFNDKEHILARHLKVYVTKHSSEQEYEEIVNEWRLVAHIMDRLLFWLFLVGSVSSTLVILVFMPMTKPSLYAVT